MGLKTSLERISDLQEIAPVFKQKESSLDTKTEPYPYDSVEIQSSKSKPKNNLNKIFNWFSKVFNTTSNKDNIPQETVTISPIIVKKIKGTQPIIRKEQTYNYIDSDNGEVMKSLKPIMLKKVVLPPDKEFYNISNFDDPAGTIALSTSLDNCIATGKLLQCAGLAIVDKSKNIQTLFHVFPGSSEEELEVLIKHVLSYSNEKDLNITMITGTYDDCDKTMTSINNVLKKHIPCCKIKLANFSDNLKIMNRAVILENGKLTCCSNSEIENNNKKITNPMDKISYIKF